MNLFSDFKTDKQNTVFFHKNGILTLKAHALHDIVTPFSEVQHRFNAVRARKYVQPYTCEKVLVMRLCNMAFPLQNLHFPEIYFKNFVKNILFNI
jgi:hypothetical protein